MSERVLTRLARTNKTVVFLTGAAVVFLGLLLPGIVGATILLALAGGLAWVLLRTWPVTPAPLRFIRAAILAALVAIAVLKAS